MKNVSRFVARANFHVSTQTTCSTSHLEGFTIPPWTDASGPGVFGPLPPYLAIGPDGTVYLDAQVSEQTLESLHGRRIFIGEAREEHETFGAALDEFRRRKEPRVYASNGLVYVECTTNEAIDGAQQRGGQMFYGYEASPREIETILDRFSQEAINLVMGLTRPSA
jgi:hypothetical protein